MDFKERLMSFEEIETLEDKYDTFPQGHKLIEVFCEEMIKDAKRTLQKIQFFLGAEHKPLSSPL